MNETIRTEAKRLGLPLTQYLMNKLSELHKKTGVRRTLLAVCPNSLNVIRSALKAAKRWDAPIKFAATLNQVDLDGGYTGLTQYDLVQIIRHEAKKINLTVPVIVAIDHGGPWLKDLHAKESWPYDKTMDAVKKSFEAAIEAGYDLIHVDPTVDISFPRGSIMPINLVAERTVELIAHAESFRRKKGFPPIAYEVGTEEVNGGLADIDVFKRFLVLLKSLLLNEDLKDVWPVFVVGKVGTDLHTTTFDSEVAGILVNIAATYGSYIKGHYTDNVDHPELYPAVGMGAANVGPEFTENEYEAMEELEKLEDVLYTRGLLPIKITLLNLLREAVIESGRWKKWLHEGESSDNFESITPQRQSWLIKTGCRYIWEKPEIVAARSRLFENLRNAGFDPDTILDAHIQKILDKYFSNFNLKGLNTLLTQQILNYA